MVVTLVSPVVRDEDEGAISDSSQIVIAVVEKNGDVARCDGCVEVPLSYCQSISTGSLWRISYSLVSSSSASFTANCFRDSLLFSVSASCEASFHFVLPLLLLLLLQPSSTTISFFSAYITLVSSFALVHLPGLATLFALVSAGLGGRESASQKQVKVPFLTFFVVVGFRNGRHQANTPKFKMTVCVCMWMEGC